MANSQREQNRNVRENFETFFYDWLIRQQNFLDQLLVAMEPENVHKIDTLIDQVLSHYREYFFEKTKAANKNVYLFFSPPWLSSFEKSLCWIGGFRPSVVFNLISGSIKDLSTEQEQRIEQLKAETKMEERKLTETMAEIQESVAGPPLLTLARKFRALVDGEVTDFNDEMDRLKDVKLGALNKADELRGNVAFEIVKILSPSQMVNLLAAAAQFQLKVRSWGKEKDSASKVV
ncbi:protein ZW2-like [Rutidosis leptorrhynchoides]|uniref:protein ZW2-like n=1 Tax=Rutidosis leptorrhynchoides TaxID=125765 RepID=UPI003A996370